MGVVVYNTLSRQKEVFQPLEEGKVRMYVCGPTVYNHVHIGNVRPAVFFDVVRRYLTYKGYDVDYVQNFTDVDDRIIDAANQTGASAKEVAESYIQAYFDVLDALGIDRANHHPKVTENMAEIIHFIEQLIDKGIAYEANGDVYYRTQTFADYGKLSHQDTEQLRAGVRVDVEAGKDSALDFALWKRAKRGEVAWDSPWGSGRPGWHIECSAMIRKYLGDQIDIHGGGIDLSFPHHENEIAQTEGLTGKPMARYWMHNAMLTIEDQKMSKSVGNFVLAYQVLDYFPAEVVRFYMLSGHYRSPLQYSHQLLEQAQNSYERLSQTVAHIDYYVQATDSQHAEGEQGNTYAQAAEADRSSGAHTEHEAVRDEYRARFIAEMDDDFNTANAISVLFELCRTANVAIQNRVTTEHVDAYGDLIRELAALLGFTFPADGDLLDEEIDQLIAERNQARKDKNFARADDIRDQLQADGILLEDTAQGTRWRRK